VSKHSVNYLLFVILQGLKVPAPPTNFFMVTVHVPIPKWDVNTLNTLKDIVLGNFNC
jgi:hypothetical protein